jgi:Uma2 family endonuclease
MSVQLLKRLFTVEEYHKMVEADILTPDDRVELIEGEIVQMAAIGRRHAACVRRLIRLFSQRLSDRVLVDVQDPVELSDRSEPQPDLALLQQRPDFYESGHPHPEDVILLVEVADTTAEADREVKIPLYAKAGIAEVWLVDINEQSLEVYRERSANGYQNVQKLGRGQTVSIQAFPDISFTIDEIFGY